MAIYAYIYDGLVWEIIEPMFDADGTEIPLSQRYTQAFASACVDITHVDTQPVPGWLYVKGKFTPSTAA